MFALIGAGLIALFFGSRTLQGIGFTVVLIGVVFVAGSRLSSRRGRQGVTPFGGVEPRTERSADRRFGGQGRPGPRDSRH